MHFVCCHEPQNISLRERSPLESALVARGELQAQDILPPGKLFRRNARSEGKSWKETFLIVKGDPEVSAPWLARQIQKLESRNFDVLRARAGARFDTAKEGPALVFNEDGEEKVSRPQKNPPKESRSRSRSCKARPTSRVPKKSTPSLTGQQIIVPGKLADKSDVSNSTTQSATPFMQILSQKNETALEAVNVGGLQTRSSWQLFLLSAQQALAESQASLGWESNPPNLADTLSSIEDWLALLQRDQPPPEAAAPWKASEELLEVVFSVTSFLREGQLKKS